MFSTMFFKKKQTENIVKIELEHKTPNPKEFVWTQQYKKMLEYMSWLLVSYYNEWKYEEAENLKKVLQHFYTLEKKYWQK